MKLHFNIQRLFTNTCSFLSIKWMLGLGLISITTVNALFGQISLGFQGGEPGDNWTYTSSGASALSLSEATMSPNKVTGTRSLVAGGNTGGGNCFAGTTGSGPKVARTFTFDPLDIASSNSQIRTLKFNWGNRFPACNGTGWDSGENLVFRAYHDGVAQPQVTLAVGSSNAQFSIRDNQYTWNVPSCVNSFYFVVSVTTDRADELLFIDDVELTTPKLNNAMLQPSPIAGEIVICEGNIKTYSVIAENGIAYTWSGIPAGALFTTPNGVNTITVNWGTVVPGAYTISVTPSSACGNTGTPQTATITIDVPPAPVTISGASTMCTGETTTLTSSATGNNTWSTGATTNTINITTPGTYSVTVQGTCGVVADEHVVTLNTSAPATISTSGATTFCSGNSVTLSSNNTSGNSWSTGENTNSITVSNAGIYTLTVTGLCGISSASQEVIVLSAPTTATIVSNGTTTLCPGSTLQLTASGGDTFLWSNGETNPAISVSDPGIYHMIAINQCGQLNSAPITVTALALPVAKITGNTSFCEGSQTTLTASGGNTQIWSTGAATSTITVTSAGMYTAEVNNSCGSDIAYITVTATSITANFSADQLSGNAPLPVQFTNHSSLNATGYHWDFGDGTTNTTFEPHHSYELPGLYTVLLTVRNTEGCTDTYTLEINVSSAPAAIVIPNVFTPNGDNINDLFIIQSENLESFHLKILNRWGSAMLELNNPQEGWDGTINGDQATEGTYYYQLKATGIDKTQYDKTGFFTLQR